MIVVPDTVQLSMIVVLDTVQLSMIVVPDSNESRTKTVFVKVW